MLPDIALCDGLIPLPEESHALLCFLVSSGGTLIPYSADFTFKMSGIHVKCLGLSGESNKKGRRLFVLAETCSLILNEYDVVTE